MKVLMYISPFFIIFLSYQPLSSEEHCFSDVIMKKYLQTRSPCCIRRFKSWIFHDMLTLALTLTIPFPTIMKLETRSNMKSGSCLARPTSKAKIYYCVKKKKRGLKKNRKRIQPWFPHPFPHIMWIISVFGESSSRPVFSTGAEIRSLNRS